MNGSSRRKKKERRLYGRKEAVCAAGVWLAIQVCLPQVPSFAAGAASESRIWRLQESTPSNAEEDLTATLSNWKVFAVHTSEVGDLWENWSGKTVFSGEGTRAEPYKIETLSELMGLSQRVASGESFAGQYFEMTQDIYLDDLESGMENWKPIGWYQNASQLSGDVEHSFQGHFDGGGHTVYGLKIIDLVRPLNHVGLFGVIDGGSVRHLTVEGIDIYGQENVGILAGTLKGGAIVEDVTVSGYVHSGEDCGGIAGEVTGGADRAVLENCVAEGVALYSGGVQGYVGGIAGNVQNADIVDCTVITQDGDADRIYGKGYVGGIAGRMNAANLYNSYVNGTIGGNGSRAVGGIVGKYESGDLILARMAGAIARTNQGSASREGTFVGTREGRHSFTYGTEKTSDFAYLYTNSGVKAKRVIGSGIDGDNDFTMNAHIGYWTDHEQKYSVVEGRKEQLCGDRYFYEELEDAVRYIVTQKLENQFTSTGYFEQVPFRLDHFAPGYMGEPVRGYLVSVPRIDVKNANGTYDTDVAALTVLPEGNRSYYRVIDKDHPAAIVPGTVVTVQTAPKNNGENRYQMIVSEQEAGGVEPPVFMDEHGEFMPMHYESGGFYSFIMPECDTELGVNYQKVTTRLTVSPEETTIRITQIRSGDRKHPDIVTEVRNEEGKLIARYLNGQPDQSVEVQPVNIHAESNGAGQTVDRRVKWSVDDTDLLENLSQSSYTMADAVILPEIESGFVRDILEREVKAQADGGYGEKINNTIYKRYGVVTASSNPETSVDGQAVYANCRVCVTFQILDHTSLRVEKLKLNHPSVTLTVTRTLTGNRYHPTETITCSEPVVVSAQLYPTQPFFKNVSWRDEQGEKLLILTPSGVNTRDCKIQVRYDPNGKENPAWIQNIINKDNEKRKQDRTQTLAGSGSCTEKVLAVSEDQTYGHVTAECAVTLKFVTIDETDFRHYGSGGSSSGGSSSGGGSSGGGSSANTAFLAGPGALPSYVVKGEWNQDEKGRWTFTDGKRAYAEEWAALQNPYASPERGQSLYDWFRFDKEGFMVTGWYTDTDGNIYYLNPVSDGTRGRMMTGWNEIDGSTYYFNEKSDGTKGALKETR